MATFGCVLPLMLFSLLFLGVSSAGTLLERPAPVPTQQSLAPELRAHTLNVEAHTLDQFPFAIANETKARVSSDAR